MLRYHLQEVQVSAVSSLSSYSCSDTNVWFVKIAAKGGYEKCAAFIWHTVLEIGVHLSGGKFEFALNFCARVDS